MTWAQIRLAYLQAVGNTPAADQEAWLHLTQGQRIVWGRVDVPEVAVVDPSFALTINQDYVELSGLDQQAYAILDVFNVTDGTPCYPEPGGMTGRNAYLDSTGKPPVGIVTRYQHDGTRLWLRDTPEAATTLRVRLRRQPPVLSDADLNSSPILPSQYDWATIWAAAENYYLGHEVPVDGQELPSARFNRAFEKSLQTTAVNPRVEEDRAQRQTMRLAGYSLRRRSA